MELIAIHLHPVSMSPSIPAQIRCLRRHADNARFIRASIRNLEYKLRSMFASWRQTTYLSIIVSDMFLTNTSRSIVRCLRAWSRTTRYISERDLHGQYLESRRRWYRKQVLSTCEVWYVDSNLRPACSSSFAIRRSSCMSGGMRRRSFYFGDFKQLRFGIGAFVTFRWDCGIFSNRRLSGVGVTMECSALWATYITGEPQLMRATQALSGRFPAP